MKGADRSQLRPCCVLTPVSGEAGSRTLRPSAFSSSPEVGRWAESLSFSL